jgi:RNA polymerase sigma-70 factor (ECF subfamily)
LERLPGFRFEAPFEHWLMRVAVRTCYDFLRTYQRTRESIFTDLTREEEDWLERFRPNRIRRTRAAAARPGFSG